MIVSITPEIAVGRYKNYAGGLGVLEGDKFYAAARLGLPYTVITLHYPGGYVHYSDELEPNAEQNTLEELTQVGTSRIVVGGREVAVSYYKYAVGNAAVVFVKVEAPQWAVETVGRLYLERTELEKFYKYVILAKSAVDYVEKYVGWDRVTHLDLQEAYAALVLLINRHPNARLVIHTPAPWGHPTFPKRYFRDEWDFEMAMEPVVLTELGLAMSREGVVVSRKMVKVTCRTFPHHCHKIKPVTNAVEIPRWIHPRLDKIGDLEEFRRVRMEVKREALRALGIETDGVVISWARRITRYKRPHFPLQLMQDLNRGVVYILGGRAHVEDHYGVETMRKFREAAGGNVYYFPNLDVETMRRIIWASDIWLFTPFSGWEASGTSFMKAGINGVPSVASRDGAVVEAVEDGVNGWLFGEDRDRLLPLESEEIDRQEYGEFLEKVKAAVEAYVDGRYWQVAYNAYKTFREKFSMERLFKDYGYI